MDREAHARGARRRRALDALAFERDREAMLAEELEDVVAELDGGRVDADVFARMSPADVQLVRKAIGDSADSEDGEDAKSDEAVGDDEAGDRDLELEEEAVRLEQELARSQRVQVALERYVEELANRPTAG